MKIKYIEDSTLCFNCPEVSSCHSPVWGHLLWGSGGGCYVQGKERNIRKESYTQTIKKERMRIVAEWEAK